MFSSSLHQVEFKQDSLPYPSSLVFLKSCYQPGNGIPWEN